MCHRHIQREYTETHMTHRHTHTTLSCIHHHAHRHNPRDTQSQRDTHTDIYSGSYDTWTCRHSETQHHVYTTMHTHRPRDTHHTHTDHQAHITMHTHIHRDS